MILKRLKEETALQHAQLEASHLLRSIQDKTLTRQEYGLLVRKFYRYFAPLEKKMDTFPELGSLLPDYSQRRKTSSLLHDLHFLGVHKDTDLSDCPYVPELPTLNHAVGCLYVLEGSTLGARIISKLLKETLEVDDQKGATYFNGYGAETGEKWKTFCQSVEAYYTTPSQGKEMVQGAVQTFSKLKTWLESE